MLVNRFLVSLAALALVIVAQGPRLHYTVEVKEGDDASFHCQVDVRDPDHDTLRFSVASWAPGSYRLLNQWSNIVNVKATDGEGRELPLGKEGDLTWTVTAPGKRHVNVAWELKSQGRARNNRSYLTKTGALLDGPRTWLYWRDHKELPAHVTVKLPPTWTVATGLNPTFNPQTFYAKDTDWLLDCPILMGPLESRMFEVDGVPVRVAIDIGGKKPEFDVDAFADVCKKITEAQAKMWGFIPFEHYTYLFSGGGGGGLEHLTSTTIGISPAALAANPRAHQGVTSHELFHAWNVKRLRPKALGPFDYDGPVRTKSLWFAEGLTNYYTNVMLARAGLLDEEAFLASYRASVLSFSQNEASRIVSPEECSWTVWDSVYLAGPISYYLQGEVLGLAMDLEIRHQTQNRKSLDDGMRSLYARYAGKEGFASEDVVVEISRATGVDLHDFFLKHVSGAQEVDWPRYFGHMGVTAEYMVSIPPSVGLDADLVDGAVRVSVLDGSPLARSGIRTGDILKSVGKTKVQSPATLRRMTAALAVGSKEQWVVGRDGKDVTVDVTIEAATDVSRLRIRRSGATTIDGVVPGSALATTGLINGDVLVGVGDRAISSRDQARTALTSLREGMKTTMKVLRNGTEMSVEVVPQRATVRSLVIAPNPQATADQLAIRGALMGRAAPVNSAK